MHEWNEWSYFFCRLSEYVAYVMDVSYVPMWNFVKTFACSWIAGSILRFTPDDGMVYKPKVSIAATIILMSCIGELSRVITGMSVGVSPFVSILLLMLAYRIHVAKGNISNLSAA